MIILRGSRRSRKFVRGQSEHGMKQVQAAAHCLTEAAENGGPLLFARIGMMQAINRHRPKEFVYSRKTPHWEKRKLKRDE
jgi:hypothetical protein